MSDKKQSCSGWHCSHCGAYNKVTAAKFCGKCGSVKETQKENQPVLKAVTKKINLKVLLRKYYKKANDSITVSSAYKNLS